MLRWVFWIKTLVACRFDEFTKSHNGERAEAECVDGHDRRGARLHFCTLPRRPGAWRACSVSLAAHRVTWRGGSAFGLAVSRRPKGARTRACSRHVAIATSRYLYLTGAGQV